MKRTLHSFPRLDQFREAVDTACEQGELAVGRYAGYEEAFAKIQEIFNNTEEEFDSPLSPLNGRIGDELGMIAKEAGLAAMVRGDELEPYFAVAHALRDALGRMGNVAVVRGNDVRWISAIRVALAYASRRDPEKSTKHRMAPRDVTFAHAVNFFTNRGIDLPLVGDDVRMSTSDAWSRLASTVWRPMMLLGDTQAMELIDELLLARYNVLLRRLRLHPTPDLMGMKMDRSLPCGHLYRLALRTLGRKRATVSPKAARRATQHAATNLAALYDVEPFSGYETMFPPYTRRILEVLVGIARYDELFTVPQCRHDVMHTLLWDLFGNLPSERTAAGWSIHDALALWQLLLDTSSENASSTFVKLERFRASLRVRVSAATFRRWFLIFIAVLGLELAVRPFFL
jgi:hypothetical protein